MPQVNVPELPLIAAASAMPSAVTLTDVGSGLGVAALIELTLLARIGVVWSTFVKVAVSRYVDEKRKC